MDYKELIEISQKAANEWRNDHAFYQAGILIDSLCAAIETLLAERDVAIADIPIRCLKCKYYSTPKGELPCTECKEFGGSKHNWQWRGPQKPLDRLQG